MRKQKRAKPEAQQHREAAKRANGTPPPVADTMKFHAQAIGEMNEAKLDGDQIREVIRKLTGRLDAYYAEAAFEFENKLHGCAGRWSDGPVLRDFVGMLQPQVEPLMDKLLKVLEDARVPSDPTLFDLDADLMHLKSLIEQAAYVVGVVAGARMAGMSSEKIKDMAGYLDGYL